MGFVSRIIMRGSLCYLCRHDFQDRCRMEDDSSKLCSVSNALGNRGLDLLSMLLFDICTKI
jgi:hypothetical protein